MKKNKLKNNYDTHTQTFAGSIVLRIFYEEYYHNKIPQLRCGIVGHITIRNVHLLSSAVVKSGWRPGKSWKKYILFNRP